MFVGTDPGDKNAMAVNTASLPHTLQLSSDPENFWTREDGAKHGARTKFLCCASLREPHALPIARCIPPSHHCLRLQQRHMLSAARGDLQACQVSPTYDKKLILRACTLSRLAYMSPEEMRLESLPVGVRDVPVYYDGIRGSSKQRTCQAYTWRFEDSQMWVAFRGTTSFATLIGDARCDRTRFILPNHPDLDQVYIHAGFLEHFASVQGRLEHDLTDMISARTRLSDVYFVGHSLGGATAQVAALYFGSLLKGLSSTVRVCCIGFGSPRSGGGVHLSDAFRQCVHLHVRVVNEDDFVPLLPPCPFGFEHVGEALWLQGESATFTQSSECTELVGSLQPLKGIHDHIISNYETNIQKFML
jgi:hypothetical protein